MSSEKTIRIKAHAGASRQKVEERDGILHIYVTVPAEKGKANTAIQKLLAEHLDIPPSRLELVSGSSSREKLFRIRH